MWLSLLAALRRLRDGGFIFQLNVERENKENIASVCAHRNHGERRVKPSRSAGAMARRWTITAALQVVVGIFGRAGA
jgi:hypothetical protein